MASDDPLMFLYLPSGRCVGFVRARTEAMARAIVDDIFAGDKRAERQPVHWQNRGYVLRRVGQRPPGKAIRKR